MIYLTAEHQHPPRTLTLEGVQYPVAALIEQKATTKLAEIGAAYLHVTVEGDAPLGYSDWEYIDGQYVRGPAGTEEERAAAALQQYRENLSCTPAQGELALYHYGQQIGADLLAGYDAWCNSPERTREELIWVNRATVWRRLDSNILAGAAAIGITDDSQLDALFELAGTL